MQALVHRRLGRYERVLPPEVTHFIGKENTQRLERTNGIIRQQTGRWHRRQNKFGKLWEQTEVTARLVVGYFNQIWQHSRTRDSAAQRAGCRHSLGVGMISLPTPRFTDAQPFALSSFYIFMNSCCSFAMNNREQEFETSFNL